MRKLKKRCGTCVHYQPSPVRGQGWCRNPALRKPHERSLVGAKELACDKKFYDFWEAPPLPPDRSEPVKGRADRVRSQEEGAVSSSPQAGNAKEGTAPRAYIYATGVLLLLVIGLGGLLLFWSREPEAMAQQRPASSITVHEPTATPAPTPTATPMPPTPTPEGGLVQVANTDRMGVYIRRTPRMADRIIAWPEGTVLEVIGPDVEAEGRKWKHVRDPRGNEGWVPAEYVKPKE